MVHWLLRSPNPRPGRRLLGLGLVFGVFAVITIIGVLVVGVLRAGGALGLWKGPRPLPSNTVERLNSSNHGNQRQGLLELAQLPPDRTRRDIAQALLQIIKGGGFHTARVDAAKELGRWGQPEDADELTPYVRNNDWSAGEVRHALIGTLGELGGPRAGDLAAERLAHDKDRVLAATALEKIGADAEPAVLAVLEDAKADAATRLAAVQVLGRIGTGKSLAALRRSAEWDDAKLADAAHDAARMIEAREMK